MSWLTETQCPERSATVMLSLEKVSGLYLLRSHLVCELKQVDCIVLGTIDGMKGQKSNSPMYSDISILKSYSRFRKDVIHKLTVVLR